MGTERQQHDGSRRAAYPAADKPNEKTILYVNGGTLAGGLQAQTAGFADWQDGNSDAAFASINKSNGGGAITTGGNSANFVGDMAIVRIYDAPLSAQQVADLYTAVTVPEPSSLLLAACGLLGLAFLGRRRRS